MAREQFRVDLRGIVDILSHHLYSSQRVYLRELLQNAVDAIEARKRAEVGFEGQVEVVPARGDEPLIVRDNGIGLTGDEMRSLLATIGGSSKRGDVSATRRKFLGQFGIGLLSSFLVSDEVYVRSRSAREPDAETILWTGHSDGTFEVGPAKEPLAQAGTEVRIVPRHGDHSWCTADSVRELAADFAELIDIPVRVGRGKVSQHTPPWEMDVEDQLAWCRSRMGFEAMGIIPLDSSMLNVRGIGFVLPYTAQPGHRTGDRIYSRGILVADSDDQLLPGWAFFCRAVIDAGDLPLTASRESLQETTALGLVRERLGSRLLSELIMVQGSYPDVYKDIVRLHATGLKSLAIDDTNMRDLLRSTLPLETTRGEMTIQELQASDVRPMHYVTSADTYDALKEVAVHAGALVINASGAHDAELLEAINGELGNPAFVKIDSAQVVELAAPADHHDADAASELQVAAGAALAGQQVMVQVSAFEPVDRPVLWWPAQADTDESPTLALNAKNPTVQKLLDAPKSEQSQSLIRSLYVIGLLLGRTPVSLEQAQLLSVAVQDLASGSARPQA